MIIRIQNDCNTHNVSKQQHASVVILGAFLFLHGAYQSIYLFICSFFNGAFSVTQTKASDERMTGKSRTGKDVEGSVHGLFLRYYPRIFLRLWEKPWKTSERIAGLQAEIWTQSLQNMKQEC
jgi:hypothetical protein